MYKTALFREINLLVQFNRITQKTSNTPIDFIANILGPKVGLSEFIEVEYQYCCVFLKISLKIAKNPFFLTFWNFANFGIF